MKKTTALKLYGSSKELAKALKVTKQAVSNWRADKDIPAKHALRIRYELKPEAFKSRERNTA